MAKRPKEKLALTLRHACVQNRLCYEQNLAKSNRLPVCELHSPSTIPLEIWSLQAHFLARKSNCSKWATLPFNHTSWNLISASPLFWLGNAVLGLKLFYVSTSGSPSTIPLEIWFPSQKGTLRESNFKRYGGREGSSHRLIEQFDSQNCVSAPKRGLTEIKFQEVW